VSSRVSYDPWGKPTESGTGALTDFGFTGHYLDRPSGLNLPLHRGYAPSIGRWLARDPIGIRGGFNLYGYVRNDPVELVDPLGLDFDDPDGGISLGEFMAAVGCRYLGIGCGKPYASPHGPEGPKGPEFPAPPPGAAGTGDGAAPSGSPPLLPPQTCAKPRFEESPRCKEARNTCIQHCAENALPSPGGGAFQRCMRECMQPQGCDY
jgi:RHS repeat-associated protein